MSRISEDKLDTIYGGSVSVTGTLISAFNEVIKTLYEAGRAVGSSIRRVVLGELCPLE